MRWSFLLITLALINLGCHRQEKSTQIKQITTGSNFGSTPDEQNFIKFCKEASLPVSFQKEFYNKLTRDLNSIGLKQQDVDYFEANANKLSQDEKTKYTASKIFYYLNGVEMRAKEDVNEALNGKGNLQEASTQLDLILLRSNMIRDDIKDGRVDKALLKTKIINAPITEDEKELLKLKEMKNRALHLAND